MVYKTPLRYRINKTLEAERESNIPWRTKLGRVILRTPFGQQFEDVSLLADGGFSINLRFVWQLYFPDEVVKRTLLHNRDGGNGQLISINILEFVVVVTRYAATYIVITNEHITDDANVQ